jgi:elongator complex protein 5
MIIDSISSLVQRFGVNPVCRLLTKLVSGEKGKYASIVGVLHEDLHSDFEVKAIERVAYTVVASVPLPDVMGVDVHGCYEIIQKRKSGKVSRVPEYYKVEDIGRLKLITDSEFQKLVGKQEEGAGEADKKPPSGLTFNLELTEEQRLAKDKVVLPYERPAIEVGGADAGTIFIDEDDDAFEGSDPDDDLDI